MIIYRTLSKPQQYELASGGSKYGILCQFSENNTTAPILHEDIVEDLLMFDDEDMAWKFYHEVNMKFEPMVIEDDA